MPKGAPKELREKDFLRWLSKQPHTRVFTTRDADTPLHHWLREIWPDTFTRIGSLVFQVDAKIERTPTWMSRLVLAFSLRSSSADVAYEMAKRVHKLEES